MAELTRSPIPPRKQLTTRRHSATMPATRSDADDLLRTERSDQLLDGADDLRLVRARLNRLLRTRVLRRIIRLKLDKQLALLLLVYLFLL